MWNILLNGNYFLFENLRKTAPDETRWRECAVGKEKWHVDNRASLSVLRYVNKIKEKKRKAKNSLHMIIIQDENIQFSSGFTWWQSLVAKIADKCTYTAVEGLYMGVWNKFAREIRERKTFHQDNVQLEWVGKMNENRTLITGNFAFSFLHQKKRRRKELKQFSAVGICEMKLFSTYLGLTMQEFTVLIS